MWGKKIQQNGDFLLTIHQNGDIILLKNRQNGENIKKWGSRPKDFYMAHPKIYKVGVRYKSTKRGIEGLTIGSYWFAPNTHCVIENVPGYSNGINNRKVVKKGTLRECRDYLKQRFGRK